MCQTILWSEQGLFAWTCFCLTWLVGRFAHLDAIWNWTDVYIWKNSILIHLYNISFYKMIIMWTSGIGQNYFIRANSLTCQRCRYKEGWLYKETYACALVSLLDFLPPFLYKSLFLKGMINELYILAIQIKYVYTNSPVYQEAVLVTLLPECVNISTQERKTHGMNVSHPAA